MGIRNEWHVIMTRPLYPKCLFGFVRRRKEFSSVRSIDYGVLCSMDDQHRTMYCLYLAQVVKLIERQDRDSSHHPERARKCAFKNQSRNWAARRQVSRWAASHRAAECDDSARLNVQRFH